VWVASSSDSLLEGVDCPLVSDGSGRVISANRICAALCSGPNVHVRLSELAEMVEMTVSLSL